MNFIEGWDLSGVWFNRCTSSSNYIVLLIYKYHVFVCIVFGFELIS